MEPQKAGEGSPENPKGTEGTTTPEGAPASDPQGETTSPETGNSPQGGKPKEGDSQHSDAEKQLFERLKKEETRRKEVELTLKKLQDQNKSDSEKRLNEVEQRVDLRLADYTADEIDEISSYAQAKGITLKEASETPFVKAAIKELRAEARSKESTPSPSGRALTKEGKQWADLKDDSERKTHFEAMRRKHNII